MEKQQESSFIYVPVKNKLNFKKWHSLYTDRIEYNGIINLCIIEVKKKERI